MQALVVSPQPATRKTQALKILSSKTLNIVVGFLLLKENCLILLLGLPFASVQHKPKREKITINPKN